jgi:site-specific DNA-methyltransferase (adenine-specific)
MIDIKQGDCLELMKKLPDNSIDLIFCDPPYALGSEVIIKPDGKPDYKKAVDFMNKWDQPDGIFWEEWFIEAKRVLKHGGHCLMFGMDRQLWFNCYYANLSGFTQKQSLYWYFISNFPKASDLSKNLDKNFGAEREVVGSYKGAVHSKMTLDGGELNVNVNITTPSTPLAKKYEGIKYSVAPLKQTNETIMVFQKPYKTGSCLHDVLAMEAGDNTLTCGGVDIEGNRCGVSEEDFEILQKKASKENKGVKPFTNNSDKKGSAIQPNSNGRFPAQTYIDSGASEIIDLQSGKLTSGFAVVGTGSGKDDYEHLKGLKSRVGSCYADSGGASRILHKCDYELQDYDLYHYCPKVSKAERNEGLEGFEEKQATGGGGGVGDYLEDVNSASGKFGSEKAPTKNPHPTVKPKALLSKILKLFKTPNDQVLLDPFMGSGSMGISAVETGFDYIGFELDQDYFEIAKTRIQTAEKKKDEQLI